MKPPRIDPCEQARRRHDMALIAVDVAIGLLLTAMAVVFVWQLMEH